MDKLNDNQLLVTILDGKTVVKIGSYPEVVYSSCPNKTYEHIQNSIETYMKEFDIPNKSEAWRPKGCWYENTGDCKDCN